MVKAEQGLAVVRFEALLIAENYDFGQAIVTLVVSVLLHCHVRSAALGSVMIHAYYTLW